MLAILQGEPLKALTAAEARQMRFNPQELAGKFSTIISNRCGRC
jgi:hypothetical protein